MKNLIRISTFLILIFNYSVEVSAKDYFVSPSGNDANNGISQATPYKTIQKAANLTLPGDTVFIMSGTFLFNGTNLTIKRATNP